MSGAVVTEIRQDEALPALAQALDTELMLEPLARAAGLPNVDGVDCSAEVLNHKLGQRCTIKYTLRPAGSTEPARPVALVGKLYGKRETAARIYDWTRALRNGPFAPDGALSLPAPLALFPALGLMIHESVPGADLRHALAAGEADGALRLAGRWLARLHGAAPPAGVKLKAQAREVRKIDRWCGEIAPHLGGSERRRLRQARSLLHGIAEGLSPCTPALIHRDFYPANVFWDGRRVCVLDFDQLALGDPALDAGHFLAHLQNAALRAAGRADTYAGAGAVFLDSYLEGARAGIAPRLPLYRAYTFLKLAAKEARRERGDWRRLLGVLTDLACREAEEATRESA